MTPRHLLLGYRSFCLLAVVGILAGCSGASAPATPAAPPPPAVIGSWSFSIETPMGTQEPVLTVTGDAGNLSGNLTSPQGDVAVETISFEGTALTFTVTVDAGGQQLELNFSGTVDGDSISGTFGSAFGDFPATGTRQ